MPSGSGQVAARVAFDHVRYANCWEDGALLIEALRPAPGTRILSIASAGDNSLHLLAHGAEVVAADLNATQLACVELRLAAICHCEDQEALAFLGFFPDKGRIERYESHLRKKLSASARAYWDQAYPALRDGMIHAGRFEHYFRLFRTRALPLVHRRALIERLLEPRSRFERESFYVDAWNTWRWRSLFRVFFSRFVMGRLGRDPEFFRYVEGSVGARVLTRARYAMTTLDPSTNPYLRYILTGAFLGALPDWTRPEVLAGIRQHADRLILFRGGVEEAAARYPGIDGFNLSDIFEYMDEATASTLYGELLMAARPGARLAYWNMLVPRACPARYRSRVAPLTSLAADLFSRDRACFYSAFHVDEVQKAGEDGRC